MSHRSSLGADVCPECLHAYDDHERAPNGVDWRCRARVRGHPCRCDEKPPHAGREAWEDTDGA